jgi:hypothetical protein
MLVTIRYGLHPVKQRESAGYFSCGISAKWLFDSSTFCIQSNYLLYHEESIQE